MLNLFRSAPSSGSSTVARALHTTPASRAISRAAHARQVRARNQARRAELDAEASSTRAHVVLGTRPGSSLWEQSDLNSILVKPSELTSSSESVPTVTGDKVDLPAASAFGLGPGENALLFEHLPVAAADMSTAFSLAGGKALITKPKDREWRYNDLAAQAATAAGTMAKLVDLRNANARGVAFENRRRIVRAFAGEGRSYNPGLPECQAALLTYKIRNLWDHLMRVPRDVANRRNLRALVHQRAKILKYLKRVDRERYRVCLQRIGVEAAAVEGELTV
ncbi:unnamed protein product [Peniophora sp. CBMAI 1063]|nr:unnamed protein product [Peniophora sp. CBMAI 1063]